MILVNNLKLFNKIKNFSFKRNYENINNFYNKSFCSYNKVLKPNSRLFHKKQIFFCYQNSLVFKNPNIIVRFLKFTSEKKILFSKSEKNFFLIFTNYLLYATIVLIGGLCLWFIQSAHRRMVFSYFVLFNNKIEGCSPMKKAIYISKNLIDRFIKENNLPGVSVTVSLDGKTVWSEGLGYSDLENYVPLTPNTVLRIASISKPIAMTIVAKLVDAGLIDLDRPVTDYVKEWPQKIYKGEEVKVTLRDLVSMKAGIRDYKKCFEDKDMHKKSQSDFSQVDEEFYMNKHFSGATDSLQLFKDDELCFKPGMNFLYTTHGWTLVAAAVEGALKLDFNKLILIFLNDLHLHSTYIDYNHIIVPYRASYYQKNKKTGRLQKAPTVDTSYKVAGGGLQANSEDLAKFANILLGCYQNIPANQQLIGHKFDLIIQKALNNDFNYDEILNQKLTSECCSKEKQKFNKGFKKLSNEKKNLNLKSVNDFNQKQVSRSGDLHENFISKKMMEEIWKEVEGTKCAWDKQGKYGMGWAVSQKSLFYSLSNIIYPFVDNTRAYLNSDSKEDLIDNKFNCFSHTGGAVGASSVLLVIPREEDNNQTNENKNQNITFKKLKGYSNPEGIVVSLITNMERVSLYKVALEVASVFEKSRLKEKTITWDNSLIDKIQLYSCFNEAEVDSFINTMFFKFFFNDDTF